MQTIDTCSALAATALDQASLWKKIARLSGKISPTTFFFCFLTVAKIETQFHGLISFLKASKLIFNILIAVLQN